MADAPPPPASPQPTPAPGPTPDHPNHDPHLPARLRAVQVRTDDLVRLRLVFIAVLRVLGLVLAGTSLAPLGSWLAEGIQDGDLWAFSYYWPRIATGVVLLGAGAALVLLGGVLGRALVRARVGRVACPMCAFELTALDRGRCTECGYEVSPALPGLAIGPVERVLAVRMVLVAALRLLGLALLAAALLLVLWFVARVYYPEFFNAWSYGYDRDGFAEIVRAAAILPIAAVALLAAGPIAALLVPMSWARKLAEARSAGR